MTDTTEDPTYAELQKADRCWQICVPYYREILISGGMSEDLIGAGTWTKEPPSPRLPFPPVAGYQCPHGHKWHMVTPSYLLEAFKADNPMTWDMLPKPTADFVCGVPRHPRDEEGCSTSLDTLGVPVPNPESAVEAMLDHILEAHGAEWWQGLPHLVSIYPGVENYTGSRARREAAEVNTAEGTDGK